MSKAETANPLARAAPTGVLFAPVPMMVLGPVPWAYRAYAAAVCAALVRLPATAAPQRSSTQRITWERTAAGRSSQRTVRANSATHQVCGPAFIQLSPGGQLHQGPLLLTDHRLLQQDG